VDEKLREVNLNFAAVEERIYAALQEALFELQEATKSKVGADPHPNPSPEAEPKPNFEPEPDF